MSKCKCILLIPLVLFLCASTASAFSGRGHIYLIGVGPAGPKTATLQALEAIKQMDVIVASDSSYKHVQLFSEYIGNKPILFDPWTGVFDYKGKSYRDLNEDEKKLFKEERYRIRDERVARIKSLLAEGKDVGLLDSGNPKIFGPGHWFIEQFDSQDVVNIPGMGCDAAAMAALGKSTIPAHDTRFLIQASPFFLSGEMKDREALKDVAKYPATFVLYMALREPEKLASSLSEVLPPDMPWAVVYWAGYPEKQRVVKGTIADMKQKLSAEKDEYMGLLFVGRFLEGKPWEAASKAAMKRSQSKTK